MRFAEAANFVWAWLIPLGIILLIYSRRRTANLKKRLGDARLIARLSREASPKRELWKGVLIILALGLMVMALARPQFGEKEVRVVRKGIDIMIAMDTSRSMLAEDFKPNRLEAAKRSVKTLIERLEGDRIGLISFAGKSFVQAPLTLDYSAALIFLDDIGIDTIPRPGTALGEAISRAAQAFDPEEKKFKALVVFSDGEDHGTEPIAQAKRAASQGVRIYCIGVGSVDGAPIPVRDERGQITGSKKDRAGRVVITKLAEETLREVALASGGAYFRATRRADEIERVYEEISQLEKKELEGQFTENYEDRFQWWVAFALLGIVAEFFISQKRKVKEAWTGRA